MVGAVGEAGLLNGAGHVADALGGLSLALGQGGELRHDRILDGSEGIIYDTRMKPVRVVLDTNVLYAALYSSRGASYALMGLMRDGRIVPCISVTLVLGYEDVLTRQKRTLQLNLADIRTYLGFVVNQSERVKIYYLWRPCLKDAKDDLVLEVAVTAGVEYLVTHNTKVFEGAGRFGIQVVTPGWLLKNLGVTT